MLDYYLYHIHSTLTREQIKKDTSDDPYAYQCRSARLRYQDGSRIGGTDLIDKLGFQHNELFRSRSRQDAGDVEMMLQTQCRHPSGGHLWLNDGSGTKFAGSSKFILLVSSGRSLNCQQ